MQWSEILPLIRSPPEGGTSKASVVMSIDNATARREAEDLYDAEPRHSIARGAISDEDRYVPPQDMIHN